MPAPTIRYQAGNEHNPADPWGRSELVIYPDGSARLDHHFSRGGGPRAWAGYLDAAALRDLLAALDWADFPLVPSAGAVPPDATLRKLTVEAGGVTQQAVVEWQRTPALPGYAEAFDLIDAVIRQLSGGAVTYPTERGQVVYGAFAIQL
jgi:hypothetical protein